MLVTTFIQAALSASAHSSWFLPPSTGLGPVNRHGHVSRTVLSAEAVSLVVKARAAAVGPLQVHRPLSQGWPGHQRGGGRGLVLDDDALRDALHDLAGDRHQLRPSERPREADKDQGAVAQVLQAVRHAGQQRQHVSLTAAATCSGAQLAAGVPRPGALCR